MGPIIFRIFHFSCRRFFLFKLIFYALIFIINTVINIFYKLQIADKTFIFFLIFITKLITLLLIYRIIHFNIWNYRIISRSLKNFVNSHFAQWNIELHIKSKYIFTKLYNKRNVKKCIFSFKTNVNNKLVIFLSFVLFPNDVEQLHTLTHALFYPTLYIWQCIFQNFANFSTKG